MPCYLLPALRQLDRAALRQWHIGLYAADRPVAALIGLAPGAPLCSLFLYRFRTALSRHDHPPLRPLWLYVRYFSISERAPRRRGFAPWSAPKRRQARERSAA